MTCGIKILRNRGFKTSSERDISRRWKVRFFRKRWKLTLMKRWARRKNHEEFLLNIMQECDVTKSLNGYTEKITYESHRNKVCTV